MSKGAENAEAVNFLVHWLSLISNKYVTPINWRFLLLTITFLIL